MSIQSQEKNMRVIHKLVSKDLGYIYGKCESGPNGEKKTFHTKSATFLRMLGKDLGLKNFKVSNNYGGIAVSGEITLIGMWNENSGLYLQLSQPMNNKQSFLYRSISNIKNYTGSINQWISLDMFLNGKYEDLIKMLLKLKKESKEKTENVA